MYANYDLKEFSILTNVTNRTYGGDKAISYCETATVTITPDKSYAYSDEVTVLCD